MTLKRDFYFEFTGMPRSGKSTVVDIVSHYMKRKYGYETCLYQGGDDYVSISKDDSGNLNLYLISNVLKYLVSTSSRTNEPHKIYLLDRGIFDKLIFTRTFLQMGEIESG